MAATLTAWKFASASDADHALATLKQLQKQALINVHDAAVVSWPADRKRPKTRQVKEFGGALGGAFWGLLFGLIFFVPILGAAAGAAIGAVTMRHVGIDDSFIEGVRSRITPGTSALFALTSEAVPDKVAAAFQGTHAELLYTNLTSEQESQLREAFAGAEAESQTGAGATVG